MDEQIFKERLTAVYGGMPWGFILVSNQDSCLACLNPDEREMILNSPVAKILYAPVWNPRPRSRCRKA